MGEKSVALSMRSLGEFSWAKKKELNWIQSAYGLTVTNLPKSKVNLKAISLSSTVFTIFKIAHHFAKHFQDFL